jgi:hypothetical protein
LVQDAGYKGIPYSRLLVDSFYFLPFGFLTVYLFGVRFRYGYLLRSLIIATVACTLPVLLYWLMDPAWLVALGWGQTSLAAMLALIFSLAYVAIVLFFDSELRQIATALVARKK